jgi:hypothetical protein
MVRAVRATDSRGARALRILSWSMLAAGCKGPSHRICRLRAIGIASCAYRCNPGCHPCGELIHRALAAHQDDHASVHCRLMALVTGDIGMSHANVTLKTHCCTAKALT